MNILSTESPSFRTELSGACTKVGCTRPQSRPRADCNVAGKLGWLARYLKEVDASETTLRFWQEIYDDQGKRVETHEKYPVDKGHQKV